MYIFSLQRAQWRKKLLHLQMYQKLYHWYQKLYRTEFKLLTACSWPWLINVFCIFFLGVKFSLNMNKNFIVHLNLSELIQYTFLTFATNKYWLVVIWNQPTYIVLFQDKQLNSIVVGRAVSIITGFLTLLRFSCLVNFYGIYEFTLHARNFIERMINSHVRE